jgi:predicted Rossmann fold nucleotide-binding protein DprA/Smf involved in DNA uptake
VRRESSKGCNLLIRDGAHPVLEPDDLIEELSLVLGPPAKVASPLPTETEQAVDALPT